MKVSSYHNGVTLLITKSPLYFISYHHRVTLLYTIGPHYGKLTSDPEKEPSESLGPAFRASNLAWVLGVRVLGVRA